MTREDEIEEAVRHAARLARLSTKGSGIGELRIRIRELVRSAHEIGVRECFELAREGNGYRNFTYPDAESILSKLREESK